MAACAAAAVLTAAAPATTGELKTYEIELDNAFGLVEGGDLKIGGVKAGQTTELPAHRAASPTARS